MTSVNECVAQFPRQPVCNDRLYARLISWAGYEVALPLPPTDVAPDPAAVKQRILGQMLPANCASYVTRVAPYLLESPQIVTGIRNHLNAYNDDATEATLGTDIDGALAVIMPKFAALDVSDQMVVDWCQRLGYPIPPGLAATGVMMPGGTLGLM